MLQPFTEPKTTAYVLQADSGNLDINFHCNVVFEKVEGRERHRGPYWDLSAVLNNVRTEHSYISPQKFIDRFEAVLAKDFELYHETDPSLPARIVIHNRMYLGKHYVTTRFLVLVAMNIQGRDYHPDTMNKFQLVIVAILKEIHFDGSTLQAIVEDNFRLYRKLCRFHAEGVDRACVHGYSMGPAFEMDPESNMFLILAALFHRKMCIPCCVAFREVLHELDISYQGRFMFVNLFPSELLPMQDSEEASEAIALIIG